MSLGKLLVTLVLLLSFPEFALAQAADTKPKAASKARKPRSSTSKVSVGLGYMIFSEPLQINDSVQKDNGYANYAGLAALADYSWTKSRWIYQVGGGIASGKATAGGFSGLSYPDSGRRTWTFTFLEFVAHYRLTSAVSLGGGLLAGNRSADWKSAANPVIQTKSLNKVIYAPELVLRFAVSRKIALAQSLSSPDLRGNTMWRWSGHFSF